MKRISEHA